MVSIPWAAIMPLLIDSAARGHEDAIEELNRLARNMDAVIQNQPRIVALLREGRTDEALAIIEGKE